MNRINKHSIIINLLQLFIDFSILAMLFYVFLFIHFPNISRNLESLILFSKDHYKAFILIFISWILISSYTKLYTKFSEERFIDFIRRFFLQLFLFAIILFAISGIKTENLYTNKESLYFLLALASVMFVTKLIIFYTLKYFQRTGKIVKERILILGENRYTDSFLTLLNNQPELGISIMGIIPFIVLGDNAQQSLNSALTRELSKKKIDTVYISVGGNLDTEKINLIIKFAEENYLKIKYLFDSFIDNQANLDLTFVDTFPIFTYQKFPLDFLLNRILKRIFDLVFSLIIFIILLWWILPFIAILVLISQGRPIFYKQKRNGLNGKEFDCLKFRTMRPDKLNNKKPTERNDPRVTKLGKVLRKTSLDELPQFINVLKGEMSIVGPRPHMVSENEAYAEIIKRYSLRHYVKPGITGLAQIKGYRGAVDTDKDMEMRIRTDIYYVRNWSFLLDLFIIYKTGKLMIFGDENAI